jgi:uncharacterized protein
MATTQVPAVEGWFEIGDDGPHLVGTRCSTCGTVRFPRGEGFCPNPACRGRAFEAARLSRTGTVWSYTDAHYQPPPPYIPVTEPFEPFALAAVELADEQLVVLGQVATGYGVNDLRVGMPVELVVETLYVEGGVEHTTWRWKPVQEPAP